MRVIVGILVSIRDEKKRDNRFCETFRLQQRVGRPQIPARWCRRDFPSDPVAVRRNCFTITECYDLGSCPHNATTRDDLLRS